MSIETAKKVAGDLLSTKAVSVNVLKPFTFASGIKSPIYCDNRSVLGHVEARKYIVDSFIKKISADTEVIVGVATAGIPWAAIIADKMDKPLAYVRGKPKAHGAGKQIEGASIKGKKIAVIEDLISTGGSSLKAVEVLKNAEAKEITVYAIFTYEFEKAKKNFLEAECKLETLSRFSVLIDILQNDGYLTEEEAKTALLWNKSPETWGL